MTDDEINGETETSETSPSRAGKAGTGTSLPDAAGGGSGGYLSPFFLRPRATMSEQGRADRLRSMRRLSRSALLLICCGIAVAESSAAATFDLFGYATLSTARVTSQPSWLDAGFGRVSVGAESAQSSATRGSGEARLGARLDFGPTWTVELHGLARAEPQSRGSAAGLSEAFATFTHGFGEASELRLRGGLFFLPTTREAIDPLWTSPYTLTLSALNSWIGEEVRPSGVDAAVKIGEHAAFGATAFGGNDTAGALLAWRGWAMGNRLSTLGERLPLPPLASLSNPAAFGEQRRAARGDAITQPVGRELDGRVGWALRGRFEGGGTLVQASAYDNRGDRALHDGEYAWRTRTEQLALQWQRGPLTLVAEGLQGKSGMGAETRPYVDIDLWAWYALASVAGDTWRVSARFDRFATHDRDHSAAETNDEYGRAVTVAGFWQPRERFRLGVEWLDLRADRPAAAESGFNPNTDATQWKIEAKIGFE